MSEKLYMVLHLDSTAKWSSLYSTNKRWEAEKFLRATIAIHECMGTETKTAHYVLAETIELELRPEVRGPQ